MSKFNFKTILGFIIALIVLLTGLNIFTSSIDREVWNCVKVHASEFVYTPNRNGDKEWLSTVKLYNKEGDLVCEILLNHRERTSCVFRHNSLVGRSSNTYMSKTMYKKLVTLIPESIIDTRDPKETVLKELTSFN